MSQRLITLKRGCLVLLVWFALAGSNPTIAQIGTGADPTPVEQTVRLIEGLRERRLFELAQFACDEALAKAGDGSADQVTLIVQQMLIEVDLALTVALEQEAEHWRQARSIGREFLAANPDHAYRVLVSLQIVMLDLAYANRSHFNSASVVQMRNDEFALMLGQKVRIQLRDIHETIEQQLLKARQRADQAVGQGLSAEELLRLQQNVKFQSALNGLLRAEIYTDRQAADRANALSEAVEQLRQLQRVVEAETSLWWQAQLALAKAQRLLGDFAAAQTALDRLADPQLRATRSQWHGRILQEQLELQSAVGLEDADDQAICRRLIGLAQRIANPSPELDLLCLRVLVQLSDQTQDSAGRDELVSQARRLTKLMEQRQSARWAAQARWLMSRLDPGRGNADSDEKLAASLARIQELEKRGEHAAAGNQMIDLALAEVSPSAAATLHLRGCWNLGRAARVDAASRERYLRSLEDHRQRWPDSTTVNQASLWLAEVYLLDASRSPNEILELVESLPDKEAAAVRLPVMILADDTLASAEAVEALTRQLCESGEVTRIAECQRRLQMVSPRVASDRQRLLDEQRLSCLDALLTQGAAQADVDQRQRWQFLQAQVLGNLERYAAAANVLTTLARQRPRDVNVLMQQARNATKLAFVEGEKLTLAAVADAATLWRTLARRLKPESESWLEAKYNVVRLQLASGQEAQADQLLRYLAALPNGWQKSALAQSFDRLQRECEQRLKAND